MEPIRKKPEELENSVEEEAQSREEPEKQEGQAKATKARGKQLEGPSPKETPQAKGSERGAKGETKEPKGREGKPAVEGKEAKKATEKKAVEKKGEASAGAKENETKPVEEKAKEGIEGKTTDKAIGGTREAAGGAGIADLVRWTPTDANNASVENPLPLSLDKSETILQAAQSVAETPAATSQETASKPKEQRPSFGAKTVKLLGDALQEVFLGNFALWDSKKRGDVVDALDPRKWWSDLSQAKGLEKVPVLLDRAYKLIDTITGFLGPLGTVLGLVSYVRFIPIPPIPAIGSALFVVSKVAGAIEFILNVVKAAIAFLRPIVDALFVAFSKDPEKRRKYQERMRENVKSAALSGFSVALSSGMIPAYFKGFRKAHKSGAGVFGSLRAGAKESIGAFRGKWAESWGVIGINKARRLYEQTLNEAYEKAMAWRLGQKVERGAHLSKQEATLYRETRVGAREPGVSVTAKKSSLRYASKEQYFAYERTGPARKLEKSREVFEAASGSHVHREATFYASSKSLEVGRFQSYGLSGPTGAASLSKLDYLRLSSQRVGYSYSADKVLGRYAWDVGRIKEVGVEAIKGVGEDVGKEALKKLAEQGLETLSSPPKPTAQARPRVEAETKKANEATEKSLRKNEAPLLKSEPVPPQTTQKARIQQNAIKGQQAVMKELSQVAQEQVLSAKAGQEEGKAIIEVARTHKKGAAHAKQGVASHLRVLQEERQEVAKGRKAAAEGRSQQKKGQEGFKKVEGEAGRAKDVVPGGQVNRDEIPLHKRVFMWAVEKFEGAKAKVTQAMTGVIMKAVEGALGLGDVGQKVDEGEKRAQEQEKVLAEEPAVVEQEAQLIAQEEKAATEGEKKGAERIVQNQKAEAAAQKIDVEAKKQEASLQKEAEGVEGDAKKYEATYGKSFEKLEKHSEAAEKGDLTPLEIRLNQEVAALQQAVAQLVGAIVEHHAQMESEVSKNVGRLKSIASKAGAKLGEEVAAGADRVGARLREQAAQAKSHRIQKAEALAREGQRFVGRPADMAAIEAVSKLLGQAVAQAESFDEEKQAELAAMHEVFRAQYEALLA